MTLFCTIWACVVVGLLLLASVIEINGARNGFLGANGFILFTSGYLTVFSSPVLFIITWVARNFLTALMVWGFGAAVYAALFMGMVKVIERMSRKTSWRRSGVVCGVAVISQPPIAQSSLNQGEDDAVTLLASVSINPDAPKRVDYSVRQGS